MVLDRVFFTGNLITMRGLTARVEAHSRANPTLRVFADIWGAHGNHVAVVGEPKVVLPIRGVA